MSSRMLVAALGFIPTAPGVLRAAEEGGGVFSVSLGLMVWTWVLFLLTLFVLVWKVFPLIAGGLEERQRKIQQAIDEARRDRAEARQLLDEHGRQLDAARVEAQRILDDGKQAGERMRQSILEEARSEQEAMLERARVEIQREQERAIEALRREAVDISLAAAEQLIKTRLDSDQDRRLVEEYIEKL
jgi:F-type H+-transporting ATPase subunit b